MRKLRRHPLTLWVTRLLTILLLAPYLFAGRVAWAQRPALTVYVLDFNNKTNLGGAVLGKVAAAQLALELGESSAWDPVRATDVQRRIQELNLRAPFDKFDRAKIATGVDANAVVYGAVDEAIVTTGNVPQAAVSITVLVEDINTGLLINGARTEGRSTPRMGFTGDSDVLLEEALGKAAARAREALDRFRLPEGTVLNTTVVGGGSNPQTEVLVNAGTRYGVRRGMEMIVTRQKFVVGRVRITDVDAELSNARVIDSPQGVRPEDRVRAIFSFSDFPRSRSLLRAANSAGGARVTDAMPAATSAPGGKAEVVQITRAPKSAEFIPAGARTDGQRLAQDTSNVPPPVTVDEPDVERGADPSDSGTGRIKKVFGNGPLRMLVGGALLLGILALGGRGGGAATRVAGLAATPFQLQIGQQVAAIRVTWDRPKAINRDQVLQYILWRADSLGNFGIVGATDSDAVRVIVDNEGARTVNAFSGQPDGQSAAGSRGAVAATGPVPGVQFRYQLATAYVGGNEDRDGDGQPDGGGTGGGGGATGGTQLMSPLSATTAWVTAMRPGAVTGPLSGQQVNVGEIDVTFTQTVGADEYVIWVSSDPNFPNNRTNRFGPFNNQVPVDQGGPPTITERINAQSNRFAGARSLFITVGAQNSQDATNPLPRGYIFSSPVSVVPETVPPPPPGAAAAGTRTLGGRGSEKRVIQPKKK